MDKSVLINLLGLYMPAIVAGALVWRRVSTHRHIAALLAGFCWCLPMLLAVQLMNLHFRWWVFQPSLGSIRGMPAGLYLGWALLWGVLPVLIFPSLRSWQSAAIFVGLDLIVMPLCSPVVQLSPHWPWGELVAAILVLLPGLLFSHWTWHETQLRSRATFWAITAALLLIFLLPEIVFAVTRGEGWRRLLAQPSWLRNLELQALAVLAIPAFSAAQEFAQRGRGTPVPFDPPQRLVTSGLYRYIASPMQVSGALVLAALGVLLRNGPLVLAGPVIITYGIGLANWHEGVEMRRRFGERWTSYRRAVPAWRPRWKPWHAPDAPTPRLYIAEGCGLCRQVRGWFEGRRPVALILVHAEDHPARDLTRITYDPMDGTTAEEGVAALARGLEHLNLAWAVLGAALRLPIIRPLAQFSADAAGFEPQVIERRRCGIG
jgi:protein-S-isoprenylcysteine O-methyltransferase Ste14